MKPVSDPDGMRLAAAAYLLRAGRVWGDRAAADLGLTGDAWWNLVGQCPWFTFDAPGPAGWSVTAAGLEALARAGTA